MQLVIEFYSWEGLESLVSKRLGFALLITSLMGQTPRGGCALEQAIHLHQAGDYPGAIREYQACIAAEPNRVEARSNLGAVLPNSGAIRKQSTSIRQL